MASRFERPARQVVIQAQREARAAGSATVEAEHLLLALTRPQAGVASVVLAAVGLDRGAVSAALETHVNRSLAVVGISLVELDLPGLPAKEGDLRFGASAKAALKRAQSSAIARGDRRIDTPHLLLGVLAAEAGTVPMALASAGLVASELTQQTHIALDRQAA